MTNTTTALSDSFPTEQDQPAEEQEQELAEASQDELKYRAEELREIESSLNEIERAREDHKRNEKKETLLKAVSNTPVTTTGILENLENREQYGKVVAHVTIDPSEEPRKFTFSVPDNPSEFDPEHRLKRFRAVVGDDTDSLDGALYSDVPLIWNAERAKYELHLPETATSTDLKKFNATRWLLDTRLTEATRLDDDEELSGKRWGFRPSVASAGMSLASYALFWVSVTLIGTIASFLTTPRPFAIQSPGIGVTLAKTIAFTALTLITVFATIFIGLFTLLLILETLEQVVTTSLDGLAKAYRMYRQYLAK